MCKVSVKMRELVKQILAAAEEQIFALLDRTITEYEEKLMCFREKQEKSPEIDKNQTVLYAPDAALVFFEETPEPERVQINALEALCSIDVSSIKEEQRGIRISSVLSLSAVDGQTDAQAEVPTFSLDSLKQEELITILQTAPEPLQTAPEPLQTAPEPLQTAPEPLQMAPEPPQTAPEPLQADFNENGQEEDECKNWEFEGLSGLESTKRTENVSEEELITILQTAPEPLQMAPELLQTAPEPLQMAPELLQTAPEPLQADFNVNGQKEDECKNWEFEGLSGPESTEWTENSSEEELLPPKKKPKLSDVSQNSNNVNSKPSKQTEAAERDGATVSYTVSNEAVSSDGKTENSSDASENEDKSGKNANQNCKENRGKLPVNIVKLKEQPHDSNHTIRTLNFEIEKGHKIAAASGNVGQKRKRKRRKKNTHKKAEKDQSESDFGVKTSNHKCSKCKATFDSLQKLKVHGNAHKRKELSCSVCKKRFKAKQCLNRHMNVHKAQPATTAGKKNLNDTFNTKQTASEKHDDETDTDKTKDSSDEN